MGASRDEPGSAGLIWRNQKRPATDAERALTSVMSEGKTQTDKSNPEKVAAHVYSCLWAGSDSVFTLRKFLLVGTIKPLRASLL